uniref:Uncharacterized protein n=1 Tax=Avena sativa TaxID=4498 RepID=A0ACD5TUC4_AVESA
MSSAPALPSPSSASVPMVVITVVGILAAFALLASYYAFVTRCQLLRAAPWRSGQVEPSSSAAPGEEQPRRGLGLPLIRMIPVVKFTAGDEEGRRVSVSSECAVCLSEFVERERVRLLPGCSHAFHIDCIDTWLQGSARCPFCRRSVTLPPPPPLLLPPPRHGHHGDHDRPRRDERLCGSDSIVIEVRGERESWGNGGGGGRKVRKTAVGDEAVESRRKEEFAVEPVRRSLSMDSSCDKHKLYVSVVKEFLAQRQQVS